MLRASLAALAAALLVGVLSLLIVESRSVDEEYYVAHAELMRAIESSRNDVTAILQGSKSAFEDARPVPSAIELAFTRLHENNALIQNTDERLLKNETVSEQLSIFSDELSRFAASGREFSARQNSLAQALRTLQEESPPVVNDLRRFNLRIQSQNAFSLAIDVIEFATGGRTTGGAKLLERIQTLRKDPMVESQAPGRFDAFAAAATSVIEQNASARTALEAINGSRIVEVLWALSNQIQSENRTTVGNAERARLLLSICTVLLLLGTGFAMYRLQASYRALNKSNRDLESANESLEERVSERTRDLSRAIEELKESQVQLVQAEKMSSLGELVAGISHEINTPLWYLMSNSAVLKERMEALDRFCGIAEQMIEGVRSQAGVKDAVSRGLIGMQAMLKDGLKDDIDEAKDLIQDSIAGLEELTELAQSLKDFSRLDRARTGDFNVNEGLDKTLLITKNKLKNKVTVHKHYGDVPLIHCSPSQINQVFLNLLTNSADAIEESGDIILRTTEEKGKVRISVSDTGKGIPADILPKVKDPFFTTKAVGKGTGLGLSIVDQIVSSHGGTLHIESQPGKGTTITVVLPVVAIKPVEEPAKGSDEEPQADEPPLEESSDSTETVAEVDDAANDTEPDDAPELATA